MSKADENFYICFYKSEDGFLGHEVSFDGTFKGLDDKEVKTNPDAVGKLQSLDETKAEALKEPRLENNSSSFEEIFVQFKNSMLGYLEILPVLSGFIPSLSSISRAKSILEFSKKNSFESTSTPASEIYSIKRSKIGEFSELNTNHDTASMVGKQIPKMMIIGVVSSYEHHFSLLLKEVFTLNPEKLESTKKTFTAKDVFESNSIEEFKEYILEKEIDSILRESFSEQINWIEKNVPISQSISKNYNGWDELVEIFERRNLFAHANGIVNSHYISKTKNLSKKFHAQKGKELIAGRRYLIDAIESICEFGIKLIQVVWRKLTKEERELAAARLGDFGYELINRGRYRLASKVLEFGRILSERDEVTENRRRIDLVNLANSYRLNGDKKACDALIDGVDWSIASNEYKICVHAVKEQDEKVIALMQKVAAADDFDAKNFEEWPVFLKMRENEDFKKEFERIYGRPYVVSAKRSGEFFSFLEIDDAPGSIDQTSDPGKETGSKVVAGGEAEG